MALSIGKTASTTTSLTLRFTGLTGTSYTTMQLTVNGVTKNVTLSTSGNSTTAQFTGLTAGTMYTATSKVVSSGGSTGTPYVGFYTNYNAVSSVSVSGITATTASASWSHPTGGRSYRLALRKGSDYTGTLVNTYYPTGTSQSFSGLTANTTYFVGIVNGYGQTETTAATKTFKTATTAPTSVTATASIDSVTVSWGAVTGATSYSIDIYSGSTKVKSNTATGTSTTISGLSSSTSYTAYVYAYNGVFSTATTKAFTTQTASPPSAVSSVTATASTATSASVSWTAVSGATSYIVQLVDSSLTSYAYNSNVGNVTSKTITGLTAGKGYFVTVIAVNGAGNSTGKSTEVILPPSAMLNLTSSVSTNTMTVSWSANTSVTSIEYELRVGTVSGTIVSSGTVTGNSKTFTGLSYNTTYYFRIRGKSSYSLYTAWLPTTDTTTPASPSFSLTSNSTTAGIVYVYFNTVAGATGYTATIYDGKTNAYVNTVSGTTSPLTFTGLKEYYPYGVYLKATSSHGDSPQSSSSITTKDVTPPSISITSAISEGVMQLVWSASDSGSGLRATNTYLVWITANGGTTYTYKGYTTNKYYSFTSDANGDEFVDGGKYYMRVTAYDGEANERTVASSQLTYVRARPNDWSWQNPKTKGTKWNLTASEWTSICTRINQFRQYKKLDNYSFTAPKVGNKFTATMYNQARSAIASMTPPTALPSAVSSGETIKATHFTGLTNSLNSIK